MTIIPILAYLDLTAWIYLMLAHGQFWRTRGLELPDAPERDTWPEVCVIIPARNEADIIHKTLPSLLTHDYPALRIVLVDDGSEDATSPIATRIAEQCHAVDRLTVINSHSQAGWKGKVSAMQHGLEQVALLSNPPRYVLFTDADIAYEKDTLKQLVAHAETNNNVLTSLMVKLHCASSAEQWLIPAFVYFFQMLYPFRWVNDSGHRTAAAAGGSMLVHYGTLMKAGGLQSVRTALIDDCALGRLMKQQGRIWLGLTQKVHSVRAYPRLNDIHAMVARTAFDQLKYSLFNLGGAMAGMLLVFAVPVPLTLFGHGEARALGIVSWLLMSITFLPLLRFYNRSALPAFALPAIAACYMGFTLDSARQYFSGRGGLWKGRIQATGASA